MSATNKHGLLLLFFTPGSKDPGVKTKKAKIKMWHGHRSGRSTGRVSCKIIIIIINHHRLCAMYACESSGPTEQWCASNVLLQHLLIWHCMAAVSWWQLSRSSLAVYVASTPQQPRPDAVWTCHNYTPRRISSGRTIWTESADSAVTAVMIVYNYLLLYAKHRIQLAIASVKSRLVLSFWKSST